MRTNGSHRHFTFLELIIASTVMMMVTLALYAYSSTVAKSWAQIVERKKHFTETLALDRVIDKALSNAVPFTWKDANNEEYPFIIGERERLRIAYLHDLHDEIEGGIRFAEFEVVDNQLIMRYSDRPFYDWSEVTEDRGSEIILAEGIESIGFAYIDWNDDNDAEWSTRMLVLDEWETETSERKDIPLAIGMRVNWLDGHWESWFRRTMGNSYRERFGTWTPLSEDKRL